MIEIFNATTEEKCNSINIMWGGAFHVQGKWDEESCILVEGEDGGWTGPVKGSYVAWGVHDLKDMDPSWDEEKEAKDRYVPYFFGCMVGDGPYPSFAGGCSPIVEDEFTDYYEKKDEAMHTAREEATELFKDIYKGEAESWGIGGLKYCNPDTGEETDYKGPRVVVSDNCKTAKKLFDDLEDLKLENKDD